MRTTHTIRLAIIGLLCLAAPAQAYPREPQIPVQGTSLQQFFEAQGQAIDVATQQQGLSVFSGIGVTQPPISFLASLEAGSANLSLYNAGDAAPPLFQIVPDAILPGWYSGVRFADSPPRAIVLLFDAADVVQGTVSYNGVNILGVGFAVSDANGVFHSEDALNAGGQAHHLYFKGTGAHASDLWLAAETDGDGDFFDAVYLLQFLAPVPVQRATWGTLKQRFK